MATGWPSSHPGGGSLGDQWLLLQSQAFKELLLAPRKALRTQVALRCFEIGQG